MNEPKRVPLPSKKNYVYRQPDTQQDVVVKVFSSPERFRTEKEMVSLLQGTRLLIPERLSIDEEQAAIVYEYIEGIPVVDLIEDIEAEEARGIFTQICDWMINFYAVTRESMGQQYILGDIHLRNFIYVQASGDIYGFDFEECRPGRIETDLARLWAFILHYDPEFTPRKKMLAALVKEHLFARLALDEAYFQQEAERETAELIARRSRRSESVVQYKDGE